MGLRTNLIYMFDLFALHAKLPCLMKHIEFMECQNLIAFYKLTYL